MFHRIIYNDNPEIHHHHIDKYYWTCNKRFQHIYCTIARGTNSQNETRQYCPPPFDTNTIHTHYSAHHTFSHRRHHHYVPLQWICIHYILYCPQHTNPIAPSLTITTARYFAGAIHVGAPPRNGRVPYICHVFVGHVSWPIAINLGVGAALLFVAHQSKPLWSHWAQMYISDFALS